MEIDEIVLLAFVGFWISWVAFRREPPGKWLKRLCEGPLMTFANYIDRNVMKMAGFFVWLSRNPIAALRIKVKEVRLKFEKPITTAERAAEYERDLEVVRKRHPAEEPLIRINIGTAMLLVLLFIALYLIAMFIHGWLIR